MSVCIWLLCQSELVYRKHVCLKTLSVVYRLSVVASWNGCPCTVGVLPRGCHRVQDEPVAKSQPLSVSVGVVTSCVLCASVQGHVSRSCATMGTRTPPRLEVLFKLSVVAILKLVYRSLQHLCGFWVLRPIRHLVRHVLSCCRQCRNPPC